MRILNYANSSPINGARSAIKREGIIEKWVINVVSSGPFLNIYPPCCEWEQYPT
jgi:hypothetical protein